MLRTYNVVWSDNETRKISEKPMHLASFDDRQRALESGHRLVEGLHEAKRDWFRVVVSPNVFEYESGV